MRVKMNLLTNLKKGSVILKIIAGLVFVLMILSIEIPREMWKEQDARRELCRTRIKAMSDLMAVYVQETDHYNSDLKAVYEYALDYDSLLIGISPFEFEVLDLDSTAVRISFGDYDHIEDLKVENVSGEPIKALKTDITKMNEKHYSASNDIKITMKFKDPKLNLKTHTYRLTSETPFKVVANYKGAADIYWDFTSKSHITPELISSGDDQRVNMARYILPDVDGDKTPYLCPSTLAMYNVIYNLSSRIYMQVKFYKNDDTTPDFLGGEMEQVVVNDPLLKGFLLNKLQLKAENAVDDFVRNKEQDGDSTYSSQATKDSLFSVNFEKLLAEIGSEEPLVDSLKNYLGSPDNETEKNYADEKIKEALFRVGISQTVDSLSKIEPNATALASFKAKLKVGILKTDTAGVQIHCPINENSVFKGFKRNFLEQKNIFGISDDENHGYIDNGRVSWKKGQ